ncbi:hypothetical protein BGZ57DRAFT_467673 [Hyaloscypha finlandica]|nr:hypothetical protein BGZ57DRAFT_467673 [Hyaloscypha finlandica]
MPSRKTKHKTSRRSAPVPSTPGRGTTLSGRSIPYQAAPNTSDNSHHTSSTSPYHTINPEVLDQHEHSQLSLHQSPSYLHTVHTQYTSQLEAGFNSLGVDLPDSMHSRVVHEPVGLTPLERTEADSTYPYEQHNSYQPISPQHQYLHHEAQYTSVAHQSEAQNTYAVPSSVHVSPSNPDSGLEGQYVVYYAPQQDSYYPTTTHGEATGPGNALAAVGTQFDGYVPSVYAQTL